MERLPSRELGKEESMKEEDVARAYGLEEGEGEARWWLGVSLATIKATGRETGGRYTLVEVLEPEGAEAPLHVHHNEDEAFWVLEGELTFEVGEETIKATPGTFLFGARDVPTATPWSRVRRGYCLSSRQRASRTSSTPPASRRRSAPCHPSQKIRPARKRWSS